MIMALCSLASLLTSCVSRGLQNLCHMPKVSHNANCLSYNLDRMLKEDCLLGYFNSSPSSFLDHAF